MTIPKEGETRSHSERDKTIEFYSQGPGSEVAKEFLRLGISVESQEAIMASVRSSGQYYSGELDEERLRRVVNGYMDLFPLERLDVFYSMLALDPILKETMRESAEASRKQIRVYRSQADRYEDSHLLDALHIPIIRANTVVVDRLLRAAGAIGEFASIGDPKFQSNWLGRRVGQGSRSMMMVNSTEWGVDPSLRVMVSESVNTRNMWNVDCLFHPADPRIAISFFGPSLPSVPHTLQ